MPRSFRAQPSAINRRRSRRGRPFVRPATAPNISGMHGSESQSSKRECQNLVRNARREDRKPICGNFLSSPPARPVQRKPFIRCRKYFRKSWHNHHGANAKLIVGVSEKIAPGASIAIPRYFNCLLAPEGPELETGDPVPIATLPLCCIKKATSTLRSALKWEP